MKLLEENVCVCVCVCVCKLRTLRLGNDLLDKSPKEMSQNAPSQDQNHPEPHC
jgi:hypothetical protein